jgi:6-phosphofructokinase 1
LKKEYGNLVCLQNNEIVGVPLSEIAGKLKSVDPEAGIIQEAKAMGISFGD